jgi:DNA-binding transcriptional regulator YiaG
VLEELVDSLAYGPDGVPVALVANKSTVCGDYETLETLTRWGCLTGFYLAPRLESVRRMIKARVAGAEDRLVASASVNDGKLIAWSCEPKRYVVSVGDIRGLGRLSLKDLRRFEISESGSRVHWDEGDVDLDLESIRYYADPEVRKAQDQARRAEVARYADAIRSFRKARGLKQSDIAGLTERQVRRIEQGESVPQSGTLMKLAVAHGLELDEYLSELASRSRHEPTTCDL